MDATVATREMTHAAGWTHRALRAKTTLGANMQDPRRRTCGGLGVLASGGLELLAARSHDNGSTTHQQEQTSASDGGVQGA